MPNPNKQDQLIADFLKEIKKPLQDEMNLLRTKIETAKATKGQELLKLIQCYVELIVVSVVTLKSEFKPTPTTQDVQNFYDTSLWHTKNVIAFLEDDRSLLNVILDALKTIANFCIQMLTFNKISYSFPLTPMNTNKNMEKVENLIHHIKSSLDELIDETNVSGLSPG